MHTDNLANSILKTHVGSFEVGQRVWERTLSESAAYANLSRVTALELGKSDPRDLEWSEVPLITKKNFFSRHTWREFVPQTSYTDVYSVIRSSGSSCTEGKNRGFFWPQLKSVDAQMAPFVHSAVIQTFGLDKRKTMVIIGLSLGSWAGGEQYSFVFKTLALNSKLPLVVFSPGNQHQEILEIIEKCHEEFDQILIGVCPSAIFYLEKMAEQAGVKLPMEKISFFVTGEPFPEAMRLELARRSHTPADRMPMLSVYGAADTGILGVESVPLIRLRQYLAKHPEVAAEMGLGTGVVPNLYHAQTEQVFLENVDGELVVTKWQGIPLVRYNLEDRIQILGWKESCALLAARDSENAAMWSSFGALPLTDMLAVYGRSQGCLFLCGSNVFESMLQQVVLESQSRTMFSGNFLVWTEVANGQQRLHWQIELKEGVEIPQAESLPALHREFVDLLSLQQPEFGEDYEKFYRSAEEQGLNVFQFHFSKFPHLTHHPRFAAATKRKIIIEQGPLQ